MKKIYITILTLLISFGSIGAVIFTPGLPGIATYFSISNKIADYTVTWYLLGYAFGQLLYGPITNRFGSIMGIRIGATLAIIGSIGAITSYYFNSYLLLVISRCIMALGAACGLKMTFTLASKLFAYKESARVMGLLTMAFAITPGLGVYLGGVLVTLFNWTSPFYLMVLYSITIFLLASKLPELYKIKDKRALNLANITKNYFLQLKNLKLILGGLLVGFATSVVYVFASVAPFISMHQMHLSPKSFGSYNFIPSIGILLGSVAANHYGRKAVPTQGLKIGLLISAIGVLFMALMLLILPNLALSLFIPMIIIYFGLSFIFGNAAAISLHSSNDNGNASAMISFINMISAVIIVTFVGAFNLYAKFDLIIIYFILILLGFIWFKLLAAKVLKYAN